MAESKIGLVLVLYRVHKIVEITSTVLLIVFAFFGVLSSTVILGAITLSHQNAVYISRIIQSLFLWIELLGVISLLAGGGAYFFYRSVQMNTPGKSISVKLILRGIITLVTGFLIYFVIQLVAGLFGITITSGGLPKLL